MAREGHRVEADERRDVHLAAASVVGFAISIFLGYWGWLRISGQHTAHPGPAQHLAHHFLGRSYLTLQLFVMHPQELPGRLPWQLEASRFLAPALLVFATVSLLTAAFSARIRHAWLTHSSRHAIICGAGVHGTRLAENLRKAGTPVVLVDINANAPGLQGRLKRRESRLVADTVNKDALHRAGISRAAQIIAVTGDDVVNAQIASAVRDLCHNERWHRKPLLLVQAEDRILARFLEDCDGSLPDGEDGASKAGNRGPEVRTFGANTLAAVTLFGGGPLAGTPLERDPDAFLADIAAGKDCHLLLAGDHDILEAIVVTALRRGRARRLREGARSGGSPSLRITLLGEGAQSYADAISKRWRLDPGVVELASSEVDPRTEPAVLSSKVWSDWRRDVTHAVVACEDEHASLAITVTLSKILRPAAELARIATQPPNELDRQLEGYAGHPPRLAPITVLSIADLAWGRFGERVEDVPPARRLLTALRAEGVAELEAGQMVDQLLRQRSLALHSDSAPAISPASATVVEGLLRAVRGDGSAVTVSALVAAGLSPDLASPSNLRRAAQQLTDDRSPDAFLAWCEYARALPSGADAFGLVEPAAASDCQAVPLKLKAATLGADSALERLDADPAVVEHLRARTSRRIAIFAGGAASMSGEARDAAKKLLTRALHRYDGLLLTGGNDVGICGAVREAAVASNVPVLGYAPCGTGAEGTWIRSTPEGDFSEAEPAAMWTDILTATSGERAGAAAADVRLVAFPGGRITRMEIALARALGAAVASLDPSEVLLEPLEELLPFGAGGVLSLPNDAMTLRAFLTWPNQELDEARRLIAARELHEQYRMEHRRHKAWDDPALVPWERLAPMLQRSNLAAVDDIPNKLHVLGLRLCVGGERLRLDDDEVERLAEIEHGRYNCERLTAGWELGRTRQLSRFVSPYLTPWLDLDEKVKQWDRDAVLALDGAMYAAGWGVASEPPARSPDYVQPVFPPDSVGGGLAGT